jgi:hypothetical protein
MGKSALGLPIRLDSPAERMTATIMFRSRYPGFFQDEGIKK